MVVNYIYNIVLIVVFFKAFILGRKYGLSAQNNLFIYLLLTIIVEAYSFIIDKIDKNILIGLQYNVYLIFVSIFFYSFYSKVLYRKVLKTLSKMSILLCLVFIIFFTSFSGLDFDEKIAIAVMLFLICQSILWYSNKILTVDNTEIFKDPNFWISSGLLIWSCFGIFRCLPMYYFYYNDKEFSDLIKSNFDVVNILLYIMFYISLCKYEYNFKRRVATNH